MWQVARFPRPTCCTAARTARCTTDSCRLMTACAAPMMVNGASQHWRTGDGGGKRQGDECEAAQGVHKVKRLALDPEHDADQIAHRREAEARGRHQARERRVRLAPDLEVLVRGQAAAGDKQKPAVQNDPRDNRSQRNAGRGRTLRGGPSGSIHCSISL